MQISNIRLKSVLRSAVIATAAALIVTNIFIAMQGSGVFANLGDYAHLVGITSTVGAAAFTFIALALLSVTIFDRKHLFRKSPKQEFQEFQEFIRRNNLQNNILPQNYRKILFAEALSRHYRIEQKKTLLLLAACDESRRNTQQSQNFFRSQIDKLDSKMTSPEAEKIVALMDTPDSTHPLNAAFQKAKMLTEAPLTTNDEFLKALNKEAIALRFQNYNTLEELLAYIQLHKETFPILSQITLN